MKKINVNLFPLINKLEAVLKRGFSHDLLSGGYRSVFKGKGMEFVGFREYSPADDAMLIDWKASLRAGKKMVKVLEEERNVSVMLLMDVSDSMLTSSHSKLKCEFAAELVGTLCYAITQVGDKAGMAMFNDKPVVSLAPSMSRHHFYSIVKSLSDPSLYGGKFDLEAAVKYLLNIPYIQKDSIVFLVSDFINMGKDWERQLTLLGLKYNLTLIVVRDPIDMRLPDLGAEVKLSDVGSYKEMIVNPLKTRKAYEMETKAQIDRLDKQTKKTASTLLYLETDKVFTKDIMKFFQLMKMGKK